jgi:hypothetical protein
MQQGRVQLDADWNEQAAILLHHLRTLAADLIGRHAGPVDVLGFEITPGEGYNFNIGVGRYYVDGILCENDLLVDTGLPWEKQPGYPFPDSATLEEKCIYLIYLDVWERHITSVEDDGIREVALGGSDTTTRAKVVWQVKAQELDRARNCENIEPSWITLVKQWQPANRGQLKAKARADEQEGNNATDPGIVSKEPNYSGTENHLYRVEIHQRGSIGKATFKWSRDNGTAAFPIRSLVNNRAALEHLGQNSRLSLRIGEWVEIVDDDYVLQGRAEPLLKVEKIDPVNMEVTLSEAPATNVGRNPFKHPLLRRWDHEIGEPTEGRPEPAADGTLILKEDHWIELEDGIQVLFEGVQAGQGHHYRTGDYWLIPARTVTGDVEWPKATDGQDPPVPAAVTPHGITHHYAPLAIIKVGSKGIVRRYDCRRVFEGIGQACKRPYSKPRRRAPKQRRQRPGRRVLRGTF